MDTLYLVITLALTLGPMLLLYLVAVRKSEASRTEVDPKLDKPQSDTAPLTHLSLWIMVGGLVCVGVAYAFALSISTTSNPTKYTGFFWDVVLPIVFFGGAFAAVVGFAAYVIYLLTRTR
jgi:hypothetical protein